MLRSCFYYFHILPFKSDCYETFFVFRVFCSAVCWRNRPFIASRTCSFFTSVYRFYCEPAVIRISTQSTLYLTITAAPTESAKYQRWQGKWFVSAISYSSTGPNKLSASKSSTAEAGQRRWVSVRSWSTLVVAATAVNAARPQLFMSLPEGDLLKARDDF